MLMQTGGDRPRSVFRSYPAPEVPQPDRARKTPFPSSTTLFGLTLETVK